MERFSGGRTLPTQAGQKECGGGPRPTGAKAEEKWIGRKPSDLASGRSVQLPCLDNRDFPINQTPQSGKESAGRLTGCLAARGSQAKRQVVAAKFEREIGAEHGKGEKYCWVEARCPDRGQARSAEAARSARSQVREGPAKQADLYGAEGVRRLNVVRPVRGRGQLRQGGTPQQQQQPATEAAAKTPRAIPPITRRAMTWLDRCGINSTWRTKTGHHPRIKPGYAI